MKRIIVSVLLGLNGIIFLVYSILVGYWGHFGEVPYPTSQIVNSVFPFVSLYYFFLIAYVFLFWKEKGVR
jgi:hypothetical protein